MTRRLFLALSLIIWMGGANVACGDSGGRPRKVVALVPGLTLADHDTLVAYWIGLEPHAAFLFSDDGTTKRLAAEANGTTASPSGARIIIETSHLDPNPSAGSHSGILVLDSQARTLARFDDVIHAVWSPDGGRIAMVKGGYPSESEVPVTYEVIVWDSRTGKKRVFHERPGAVEWLGPDSLLLDFYRSIRVLDLRTGRSSVSSFHSTLVSPDHRFSLSNDAESDGPHVWDESSGAHITPEIQELIGGARMRPLPAPFWVAHPTRGALLCVPTCLYPGGPAQDQSDGVSCWTYVIDLSTKTVLKRIPGRALGPSADFKSAVFVRGRGLRFENLTAE